MIQRDAGGSGTLDVLMHDSVNRAGGEEIMILGVAGGQRPYNSRAICLMVGQIMHREDLGSSGRSRSISLLQQYHRTLSKIPLTPVLYQQPELDYLSRLVLTKIDLSSDKFIPRDLLKSWMTTGSRYA